MECGVFTVSPKEKKPEGRRRNKIRPWKTPEPSGSIERNGDGTDFMFWNHWDERVFHGSVHRTNMVTMTLKEEFATELK